MIYLICIQTNLNGVNFMKFSLIGTIWSTTALLYVVLGLVFRLWHPGWILFPIIALGRLVFKKKN